jgi:hypothetical protein
VLHNDLGRPYRDFLGKRHLVISPRSLPLATRMFHSYKGGSHTRGIARLGIHCTSFPIGTANLKAGSMPSLVGRAALALPGASAVKEAANLRVTVTCLGTQGMKLTTPVMTIVTGTASDAIGLVKA